MTPPSVLVFDVGHGCGVLLQDESVTTVIDCKESTVLIEFLLSRNIKCISQVIISHADADHIDGILALIQTDYVKLGTVFVNADASKDSQAWTDLRIALQDAEERGKLKIRTEIGAGMADLLKHVQVSIEVIAPGIASRLSGPGGRTAKGARATSNTTSVVLRLHHENHPVMLIPGDLDDAGLEDIIARNKHLNADILIFPHHGGHMGHGGTQAAKMRGNAAFAKTILAQVAPKLLIFSIGRGWFSTPRPEIMSEVHAHNAKCHIHCTQLSEHCQATTPAAPHSHLAEIPALGRRDKNCCGGSIEILFAGKHTVANLDRKRHIDFVNQAVASPLCKQKALANKLCDHVR